MRRENYRGFFEPIGPGAGGRRAERIEPFRSFIEFRRPRPGELRFQRGRFCYDLYAAVFLFMQEGKADVVCGKEKGKGGRSRLVFLFCAEQAGEDGAADAGGGVALCRQRGVKVGEGGRTLRRVPDRLAETAARFGVSGQRLRRIGERKEDRALRPDQRGGSETCFHGVFADCEGFFREIGRQTARPRFGKLPPQSAGGGNGSLGEAFLSVSGPNARKSERKERRRELGDGPEILQRENVVRFTQKREERVGDQPGKGGLPQEGRADGGVLFGAPQGFQVLAEGVGPERLRDRTEGGKFGVFAAEGEKVAKPESVCDPDPGRGESGGGGGGVGIGELEHEIDGAGGDRRFRAEIFVRQRGLPPLRELTAEHGDDGVDPPAAQSFRLSEVTVVEGIVFADHGGSLHSFFPLFFFIIMPPEKYCKKKGKKRKITLEIRRMERYNMKR